MNTKLQRLEEEHRQTLEQWIQSCIRGGKISRNTVAVGIVVIDQLRRVCPVDKGVVVSPGGEIKGARSGLTSILESYGIPHHYLKEVTTRQGHQDGQRLFDAFKWGEKLCGLSKADRDQLLSGLVGILTARASDWLQRQNLRLQLDRRQSPAKWVQMIVDNARDRSGGVVEQHLVGAKLERRFEAIPIPNHPAHAADAQTAREGDFAVSNLVYHVTATC